MPIWTWNLNFKSILLLLYWNSFEKQADKYGKILISFAWKEPYNVYNGHKNAKKNLKGQEKSKIPLHKAVAIWKVKNIFDQFYHGITKINKKFKF